MNYTKVKELEQYLLSLGATYGHLWSEEEKQMFNTHVSRLQKVLDQHETNRNIH